MEIFNKIFTRSYSPVGFIMHCTCAKFFCVFFNFSVSFIFIFCNQFFYFISQFWPGISVILIIINFFSSFSRGNRLFESTIPSQAFLFIIYGYLNLPQYFKIGLFISILT